MRKDVFLKLRIDEVKRRELKATIEKFNKIKKPEKAVTISSILNEAIDSFNKANCKL